MIRIAEAVLPGHPDKFCDQIADAIVQEAIKADSEAFVQIEVGVWSDQAWLSGNIVSRQPLSRSPSDILIAVGLSVGFDDRNWIDARRYTITDSVCQNIDDPTEGRDICDDQSIVIGYAGYDNKTRYLPPEQFLVHSLCNALWHSSREGDLKGCGPDGKVLVILREEATEWRPERILVTLQHQQSMGLLEVTANVQTILKDNYEGLSATDSRWCSRWPEVEVVVNPNGPYYRGGSDGDNGQTGRKLVMDFYGSRIPIGGGALSGKHPGHIDRLAAYAAREAAIHAVRTGAKECMLRLTYAPNCSQPLDVNWDTEGRSERWPMAFFNFDAMLARIDTASITSELGRGTHFWDTNLPWNR